MSENYVPMLSDQDNFDFFGDCSIGLDFNHFPLLSLDNLDDVQFPISPGLTEAAGIERENPTLNSNFVYPTYQDDYSAFPTERYFHLDHQLPAEQDWRFVTPENPSSSATFTTAKRKHHEIDDAFEYNKVASKRKWQESVSVFSMNGGKKVVLKQRHAFTPSRKAEVALTRLLHSCIQCRMHKESCNFGLPCDHCIKRAGTLALGGGICTRQSLVATRFDSVDLFRVAHWKEKVEALGINSTMRASHVVYIGYPPLNANDLPGSFIGVPVIHFKAPGQRSTRRVIDYDYYGAEVVELPNASEAIAPEASVPLEALILSYKQSHYSNFGRSGPFSRLQIAVHEFAELYCSDSTKLPLYDFLKKAIRMRQLFDMWRLILSTKERSYSGETRVASNTITTQLRSIISTEIVHLEVHMLSQIEKLIYPSGGVGRNNPLALWVCLWTLIFSYEEHLIYLRASMLDPQNDQDNITQRYYLTRHLYNTLTSIYTALYKTTSPLTLDWRIDDISLILGKNRELIQRFSIIKTELFWFSAYKEQVSSEDALFKTLVMENEMRLLFKAQK